MVTCDTKCTAQLLYNECDGLEFEHSSNILDLRFIPDDVQFAQQPRYVLGVAAVETADVAVWFWCWASPLLFFQVWLH